MIRNPIAQALALGYGVPKVLDFVEKAFPTLSPRIKKAKDSGYGAEQILSLIQKGMGGPDESMTESQIHTQRDIQQNAVAQDIYKLAAGAAGSFAAARGLPAIAKAVPQLGEELVPEKKVAEPQKPIVGEEKEPSPPVNEVVEEKVTIPSISPERERATQFFNTLGAEEKVIRGVREGKSPEEIAKEIQLGFTPEQRKEYHKARISGKERPIEEHVKEFVKGPEGLVREDIVSFGQPKPNIPSPKPLSKESLAKGDFVLDDSTGKFGQIKDIRNTEGLLDEDGKLHKAKIEKLEKPSEDVIKAVSDLLKIPEVDKSSVISLATYRPSMRQLFIQFHNGQTYAYEDVPEEMGQKIAHALGVAKTTGKNIYGAWDEGIQSRGAALIQQIIKDPKYSKENEGKTWEKLGTYYDYWNKLRKHAKGKK